MPTGVNIRWKWMDDKFFRKLDPLLENALEMSTRELADDTRARAPVKSGKLRNSIETEMDETDRHEKFGRVIARAPYALFVEYGTRYRSAKPFMRPAFAHMWHKILNNFKDLIK